MFTFITVLCFVFQGSPVYAALPPTDGECENKFIDVNALAIMGQWTIVKHTDNIVPPVQDGCRAIKFGRRTSWGSKFRMDVLTQVKDEDSGMMVEQLTMRVDVAPSKEKGFTVSLAGVPTVFPPTIMITKMAGDEEKKCFAAWTCDPLQNAIQKAAWIVCNSPAEVDEETLSDLDENVKQQSEIDGSYLIRTKHEDCTF